MAKPDFSFFQLFCGEHDLFTTQPQFQPLTNSMQCTAMQVWAKTCSPQNNKIKVGVAYLSGHRSTRQAESVEAADPETRLVVHRSWGRAADPRTPTALMPGLDCDQFCK